MQWVQSISTFILLPLMVAACAATKSTEGSSLTPTIYYKPTIHQDKTKCSANALKDMISPDGKILETLCEADYKQCLLQGSCFVQEGDKLTSYNYHSKKDNIHRFIVVDLKECPFGYGARSSCLDPFFSVAADLSIYKVGDVIFIPRLVGAKMPTGEVHDGFVIIRDSGGGVTGATRFDFFTGFYDYRQKENSMAQLGFGDPVNSFEFRMATALEAQSARERRNYPGLRRALLDSDLE